MLFTTQIIDFGSAVMRADCHNSYVQSRWYRAPEVMMGLPWGSKVDMWGVRAYEKCTCVRVFGERGRGCWLQPHCTQAATRCSDTCVRVSRPTRPICCWLHPYAALIPLCRPDTTQAAPRLHPCLQVGCVLAELLVGQPIFHGGSVALVLAAQAGLAR